LGVAGQSDDEYDDEASFCNLISVWEN